MVILGKQRPSSLARPCAPFHNQLSEPTDVCHGHHTQSFEDSIPVESLLRLTWFYEKLPLLLLR
eukprot:217636-Amphidinium_carterae.1